MNERDETRLRDMRDAARRAIAFVSGRSRPSLEEDHEVLGFAVVRAIEIVGEAASRISGETKALLDQVPWHAIVGMRNLVVHDYSSVDYDVVWQVVTEDLPTLIALLDTVLQGDD